MDHKPGLLSRKWAVSYTHLDVYKRQGIQRRRVEVLNHAIRIHIAKARDLPAQIGSNGHFAAADKNIRLDADGKQLLHAVLRWFGFEFSRRVQIWNQRYMDKRAVFRAHAPANLADGLKAVSYTHLPILAQHTEHASRSTFIHKTTTNHSCFVPTHAIF